MPQNALLRNKSGVRKSARAPCALFMEADAQERISMVLRENAAAIKELGQNAVSS
jgi:hypothetical protein